jgi:GNAT superfamily N-acetyltransferase
MTIRPFADDDVAAAAGLVAHRDARHRAAEPGLPEAVDPAAEIAEPLEPGAVGLAAERDGYPLGTRGPDEVGGTNAWVEPAGQAVAHAELARELYRAAAAGWVGEGRAAHHVFDARFRPGLGRQQAYGVRGLEPAEDPPQAGAAVREARAADLEALVAIAPVRPQHQARPPVFSAGPRHTEEELHAEIAEVDGCVVGSFLLVPTEESGMHSGLARRQGAVLLARAATAPESRGTGAERALTAASLAWARGRGYECMVTDWRMPNLLVSRFWARRGFWPTFVRLHRFVPPTP